MTVIAVDAIHAEPAGSGLARYAREVTRRLVPRLQEVATVVVVAGSGYEGPKGDRLVRAPDSVLPSRGGSGHVLRLFWRNVVLPRRLRKEGVEFYYSPVPETVSARLWQLVTVHDLIPLRFPRVHWKQVGLFWLNLRLVTRRAERVVSISDTTRRDIERWAGRALTARVSVIHNGITLPDRPKELGDQSSLEDRYVLYVGDVRPYKGVDRAVEALARCASDSMLYVVGKASESQREQVESLARAAGVAHQVEFLGYLHEQALDRLYAGAAALVFPTRAEGFGLVPLEAFARGCPAIVTDLPVLREVLDGEAFFVPADDIRAWAEAIDRHVNLDDEARVRKADRVRRYAEQFTWDRTVEGIMSVLEPEIRYPMINRG